MKYFDAMFLFFISSIDSNNTEDWEQIWYGLYININHDCADTHLLFSQPPTNGDERKCQGEREGGGIWKSIKYGTI